MLLYLTIEMERPDILFDKIELTASECFNRRRIQNSIRCETTAVLPLVLSHCRFIQIHLNTHSLEGFVWYKLNFRIIRKLNRKYSDNHSIAEVYNFICAIIIHCYLPEVSVMCGEAPFSIHKYL